MATTGKPLMAFGADRSATIKTAINHLTTTSPAVLHDQLKNTRFHQHLKDNPAAVADFLTETRPNSGAGRRLSAWKAAQQVLEVAGIPDPTQGH